MSDLAQPIERFELKNANKWTRIEIVFYLPESHKDFGWTIEMLAHMAHFPWNRNTFFGWYHTYTSLPPRAELGSFQHILFLPPHFEGIQFDDLRLGGTSLHILWGIPVLDAELEFQKQYLGSALEKRLWPILHATGPWFDPSRQSVV